VHPSQHRAADAHGANVAPDAESVTLDALPKEASNPIAYFADCIRNNKPIEESGLGAAKCASDGNSGRRARISANRQTARTALKHPGSQPDLHHLNLKA
jgi:hypothetical protein